MDAPRSRRIEFLDSIRGLAALAVLFSHAVGIMAAPAAIEPLLTAPWLHFIFDGKAAVAMFFVLSGFVLARPYVKSSGDARGRPLKLIPFYIKRITRIYFPFFCVLCLSAVISLWFFKRWETIPAQTTWFNRFWSAPWTACDFLEQCFFQLHDADKQFIVQDWSLGVELKASAMLPFLVLAWRYSAWWLAVIGLAFLCFVHTGHYYFGFIMGIFLAAQGEWLVTKIRPLNLGLKCLILLAGLVLYDAASLIPVPVTEKQAWIAISAGCVMILLAAFSSKRIQKALEHKSVVFLGRISYGVYLLQILVLLTVTPWFVQALNRAGFVSPMPIWCLAFLISVATTIIAGAIFFQVVEKPSMQFGHALAARFGGKRQIAPVTEPSTVPREP